MRKTKRTEITVETERLLVISRPTNSVDIWCEQCGALVPMIGLDEATLLSGQRQREIIHRLVVGSLHFTESPQRLLWVCLHSLLKETSREEPRSDEQTPV